MIQQPKSQFNALDALDMDIKPVNFLVEPWIAKADCCMVYASTGSGKSIFALGLAIALATENDFLGMPSKAQKVHYFDGEMGIDKITRRIKKQAGNCTNLLGLKENLKISSIDENILIGTKVSETDRLPSIAIKAGQKMYLEMIGDAEFVIFDNLDCLSYSIGKDLTEFQRWEIIRPFLSYLKTNGKTVLLVHHANRQGLQKGDTKKEQFMDMIFKINNSKLFKDQKKKYFEVFIEKARDLLPHQTEPKLVHVDSIDGKIKLNPSCFNEALVQRVGELMRLEMAEYKISNYLGMDSGTVAAAVIQVKDRGLDDAESFTLKMQEARKKELVLPTDFDDEDLF